MSVAWIRSSLAPHVPIGDLDLYADSYGYFWYSKTHEIEGRPVLVSFASGNGGNKLYVAPDAGWWLRSLRVPIADATVRSDPRTY